MTKKNNTNHATAMATCLMLCGQVGSAVRFITDRVAGGGVLSLDSPSNVPNLPG